MWIKTVLNTGNNIKMLKLRKNHYLAAKNWSEMTPFCKNVAPNLRVAYNSNYWNWVWRGHCFHSFYVRCLKPPKNASQAGQDPSHGPHFTYQVKPTEIWVFKGYKFSIFWQNLNGFPTVYLVWGPTHVGEKLKMIIFEF